MFNFSKQQKPKKMIIQRKARGLKSEKYVCLKDFPSKDGRFLFKKGCYYSRVMTIPSEIALISEIRAVCFLNEELLNYFSKLD